MIKRLSDSEFKSIYAKVPRLCVEIVVSSPQGILLTQRAIPPKIGFWHIPGGTVLFNESLKKALKRNAKRELGVDIASSKFLTMLEYYKTGSTFGHDVSLVYLVKIKQKDIKVNNEASQARFFKKIPSKIVKEHKQFLKHWMVDAG